MPDVEPQPSSLQPPLPPGEKFRFPRLEKKDDKSSDTELVREELADIEREAYAKDAKKTARDFVRVYNMTGRERTINLSRVQNNIVHRWHKGGIVSPNVFLGRVQDEINRLKGANSPEARNWGGTRVGIETAKHALERAFAQFAAEQKWNPELQCVVGTNNKIDALNGIDFVQVVYDDKRVIEVRLIQAKTTVRSQADIDKTKRAQQDYADSVLSKAELEGLHNPVSVEEETERIEKEQEEKLRDFLEAARNGDFEAMMEHVLVETLGPIVEESLKIDRAFSDKDIKSLLGKSGLGLIELDRIFSKEGSEELVAFVIEMTGKKMSEEKTAKFAARWHTWAENAPVRDAELKKRLQIWEAPPEDLVKGLPVTYWYYVDATRKYAQI